MTTLRDFRDRTGKIEECYEYMLAYAARGLPSDAAGASDGQMRQLLSQAVEALSGLPDAYRAAIDEADGLQPVDRHHAFLEVLRRDSLNALAAMQLVLGQPAISSPIVDNLNASSHLRALLTDLFLIDEIAASSGAPVSEND
jgi:hypothetical protein